MSSDPKGDGEQREACSLKIPVSIDLMEYENRSWGIDGSVEPGIQLTEFIVRLNGEKLAFQNVPRYAQIMCENQISRNRTSFSLKLLPQQLQKKNRITFSVLDEQGKETRLPVAAVNYQAKVYSGLKYSYWCFDRYLVTLKKGGEDCRISKKSEAGEDCETSKKSVAENVLADSLEICRAGALTKLLQELKLLQEILRTPYGSRKMFIMRCMYWLYFPLYAKKNIWITFDKLYKGGDCGEYFYKYLVKNADASVVPVYIINCDAPDRKRLEQEGYHPAIYRSREQRLSYLYAKMVFGTHSGVNSFCGFNNWEIRFIQDRLRAVNTCIQHGLSVQNLEADSNRTVNNNKRYYCASRCEIENLSRPEYDYGKDVLRLTGIPRYDGLVNDDRRQILITPTWRSYIAMPSVMGSARPYNPEFKNTEYFRIFEELLSDKKLLETARRTGYRIIYLLHPVISAQKRDFTVHEGIELLSSLETDYETVLTQSSLMVTDYSGVQFDFAYMRKPVVYYHPPALPPHYTGGGFDYETQGFGEICTQKDALVELLCGYMEQGCVLKPFYRARQDEFFAYDDLENCRRIYEDARAYQISRG